MLCGYFDPPAGVEIGESQHFNAYFPGQAIGMGQMLYNEVIEYEDGKFWAAFSDSNQLTLNDFIKFIVAIFEYILNIFELPLVHFYNQNFILVLNIC